MSTQPRPWVPFSFGGRAPAPAPAPPPPPPPPHPSIPTRPTLPQQPPPPPPPPPTAQLTSPQPSTTLAPTRPFVPPPAKSPQSPVRNWILSSNKSPPHQIQTKPAASTEPPTTVKVPTPPPLPKLIKPSQRAPPESPKLKLLDKTRGRNDGASPRDKGMIKKLSHSEDKLGSSVITLAGENKGALMEVKPWVQHEKQAMSVSGEEGKSRDKSKSKGGIMAGYFNSNVQGLNNSIVCNGSIIYNDPGIHISVTRKPSRH